MNRGTLKELAIQNEDRSRTNNTKDSNTCEGLKNVSIYTVQPYFVIWLFTNVARTLFKYARGGDGGDGSCGYGDADARGMRAQTSATVIQSRVFGGP